MTAGPVYEVEVTTEPVMGLVRCSVLKDGKVAHRFPGWMTRATALTLARTWARRDRGDLSPDVERFNLDLN